MKLVDLKYEVSEHIAEITLDRESARNAYSNEMIHSIEAAFDAADADANVRCVVLTGAGKTFSAGGDVKAMLDKTGMFEGGPSALRQRYLDGIHRVPRRIARFEKPIVVALNGAAIGAGLDLACMGDVRIASRDAQFGSTFVKLGLVPGDGGAFVLSRVVGFPRALELMLTGRLIDSEEAERIGLVHQVVPAQEVLPAARAKAKQIADNAPLAVRLTKVAAYQAQHMTLEQALNAAATYQGIAQNTADHLEGVRALLEKRPPRFEGR
ncbi:MAG: enoyl-CoA hydratase-related protein [Myxococcales bacterium]